MSQVVIEVGFDWNVGSIGRMLNDPYFDIHLYPLQYGFVGNYGSKREGPMWPTQLKCGDQIAFVIFDITRDPMPSIAEAGSQVARPLRFEAHFQHSNETNLPQPIFNNKNVPIQVESPQDFFPLAGHVSRVYNVDRATPSNNVFPAWALGTGGLEFHELRDTPNNTLMRALMVLILEVEIGSQKKTFILDPELFFGPFG